MPQRTPSMTPVSIQAHDSTTMDEKTHPNPTDTKSQIITTIDILPTDSPAVGAGISGSTPAANALLPSKPNAKKPIKKTKPSGSTKPKKCFKKRSSKLDDTSSESNSGESDETTSSSDSDLEDTKSKAKAKKAKAMKAKKGDTKTDDSGSDSSEISSSSDEEEAEKAAKAKRAKKMRKLRAQMKALKSENDSDFTSDTESSEAEEARILKLKKKRKAKKAKKDAAQDAGDEQYDPTRNPKHRRASCRNTGSDTAPKPSARQAKKDATAAKKAEVKRKKLKGTKLEFVRVDRLWDYDKHAYITRQSRTDTESGEFDQYVFNVRRIFDWDNKHVLTMVDIKSKPLKEALIKVMGIVKGISLAEDTPSIDPNMIFLYLEELRSYMKELKANAKIERKKKVAKEITVKRKALKVLIKYLDKDYDETKKTLYPMLENGTITFSLLWALFKSNEIVYAPTYGTEEVPRAFKVEYANLVSRRENES